MCNLISAAVIASNLAPPASLGLRCYDNILGLDDCTYVINIFRCICTYKKRHVPKYVHALERYNINGARAFLIYAICELVHVHWASLRSKNCVFFLLASHWMNEIRLSEVRRSDMKNEMPLTFRVPSSSVAKRKDDLIWWSQPIVARKKILFMGFNWSKTYLVLGGTLRNFLQCRSVGCVSAFYRLFVKSSHLYSSKCAV